MSIIALPTYSDIGLGESVTMTLERAGVAVRSPTGNTIQRLARNGDRWRADISIPSLQGRAAGLMATFIDQASAFDASFYVNAPYFGNAANLAPDGDFVGSSPTGWTTSGASVSFNARKLVVTNTGAAEGYAELITTATAAGGITVMVDFCSTGSNQTSSAKIEMLRASDDSTLSPAYTWTGPRRFARTIAMPGGTIAIKIRLSVGNATSGASAAFANLWVGGGGRTSATVAAGSKRIASVVNYSAAAYAGDFVTVATTAGTFELKRLTDDRLTNNAPLEFEPALRSSLGSGALVLFGRPFSEMILSENLGRTQVDAPNLHGFTIAAEELLQ